MTPELLAGYALFAIALAAFNAHLNVDNAIAPRVLRWSVVVVALSWALLVVAVGFAKSTASSDWEIAWKSFHIACLLGLLCLVLELALHRKQEAEKKLVQVDLPT